MGCACTTCVLPADLNVQVRFVLKGCILQYLCDFRIQKHPHHEEDWVFWKAVAGLVLDPLHLV